ncbi:hypothetical protein GCM10023206_26330 [Acinetobacter puyangensis]|uniref:tRNA(fMet)-specific endonuclease VapC n=2 Tax=Acinetobacter puyangensis TaxID=1096779 RepID=A0A240E4A8_9GAMM|nr:tRNA(fMet)-specific endonuclease VapC [Acinetobacter puyangensis]
MILCDTNIFIEQYKGNLIIVDELKQIEAKNIAVSSITSAELYFGARNKVELLLIQRHLASLTQIPLNESISRLFCS